MQVGEDGKLSELHTRKTGSGVDVSDPALRAAWADVRDDGSDSDWCWFGYAEGSKAQIELVAAGGGGVGALVAASSDSCARFGGLRVRGAGGERGTRFLTVTHAGSQVGGMAKGRAGMHRQGVLNLLEGCSGDIEVAGAPLTAAEVCAQAAAVLGYAPECAEGGSSSLESPLPAQGIFAGAANPAAASECATAGSTAAAAAPAAAGGTATAAAPAPAGGGGNPTLVQAAAHFAYSELRSAPYPEGVDANARETYLTDAEFVTVFGMGKEQFGALPKWKQTAQKKKMMLW